jgi:hypothetical protein
MAGALSIPGRNCRPDRHDPGIDAPSVVLAGTATDAGFAQSSGRQPSIGTRLLWDLRGGADLEGMGEEPASDAG